MKYLVSSVTLPHECLVIFVKQFINTCYQKANAHANDN